MTDTQHTDRLPDPGGAVSIEDDEPARFVYLVEGEPYVGTVDDVAHALELAHYSAVDVSPYAWTFDAGEPERHEIEVQAAPAPLGDYQHVTVRIDGAEGRYKIDLRA